MVEMKGKNVLVVGMARSGVAAAQMLSRLGAKLTLTDTRTREQMKPAIEQLKDIQADWRLGTEPDDLIQGKDYIVLSPSVYYWAPWVEKAKQNGTVVISELQLGAWFTKGDFISITGTNGKTTTTTLVGEIFKNNGSRTHVLGNIGVPVCTRALDTRRCDRLRNRAVYDGGQPGFSAQSVRHFELNRRPSELFRDDGKLYQLQEKSV